MDWVKHHDRYGDRPDPGLARLPRRGQNEVIPAVTRARQRPENGRMTCVS